VFIPRVLRHFNRGTGADDETAEPFRVQRRSEERLTGANVGTNDVRAQLQKFWLENFE